jgi:hypothetical protein
MSGGFSDVERLKRLLGCSRPRELTGAVAAGFAYALAEGFIVQDFIQG